MNKYRVYFITKPGTIYEQTPYVITPDREDWENETCIFTRSIEFAGNYVRDCGGALGGFGTDAQGRRFRVAVMP